MLVSRMHPCRRVLGQHHAGPHRRDLPLHGHDPGPVPRVLRRGLHRVLRAPPRRQLTSQRHLDRVHSLRPVYERDIPPRAVLCGGVLPRTGDARDRVHRRQRDGGNAAARCDCDVIRCRAWGVRCGHRRGDGMVDGWPQCDAVDGEHRGRGERADLRAHVPAGHVAEGGAGGALERVSPHSPCTTINFSDFRMYCINAHVDSARP